jgi:hypothetical protein
VLPLAKLRAERVTALECLQSLHALGCRPEVSSLQGPERFVDQRVAAPKGVGTAVEKSGGVGQMGRDLVARRVTSSHDPLVVQRGDPCQVGVQVGPRTGWLVALLLRSSRCCRSASAMRPTAASVSAICC